MKRKIRCFANCTLQIAHFLTVVKMAICHANYTL